jgi:hypothetical protein
MSDMDGYRDPECRVCGPVCECPQDGDEPQVCAHGVTVAEWCALCDVTGAAALAQAVARALDQLRHKGAR